MKNAKRIASLVLALVMVFAMAITVSARTEVTDLGTVLIKDSNTVKASEKTFEAYKALDVTLYVDDEGKLVDRAYSVPANLADFYAGRYGLDKNDPDFDAKVQVNLDAELKNDMYTFAREVAAAGADVYTGNPAENGYLFTDLPLGYYAVMDTTSEGDYVTPVSAIILDTVTPNLEIKVKAEKPSIDKNIDEDNDLGTTDDRVENSQAAIGDTITYVVTSQVPEMTGYKKYFFIMKDHMSEGLDYTDNMTIKVGDKVLTEDDYTLTVTDNEDGSTDLKIVFKNFIQYNTAEYIGKTIEVTYTAQLNKDAVITTDPNTNDVYLQYSHNPNVDYGGVDEPNEDDEQNRPALGETEKEVVYTYTTAIELVKIDALGNRLQGAEFTLTGEKLNIVRVETESFLLDAAGEYWKLKDGSYTTTDPESLIEGVPVDQDLYASVVDKYSKTTTVTFEEKEGESVTATATVGTDGVVRFEGLAAGVYTITEIKAPEGYNMLTEPLTVTIGWDKDTADFTYNGADDYNGIARLPIVNQSGDELPETGGMGTTIFYIVGGVLLVAALVVLITRKRVGSAN